MAFLIFNKSKINLLAYLHIVKQMPKGIGSQKTKHYIAIYYEKWGKAP
jgi:hypothetical protein